MIRFYNIPCAIILLTIYFQQPLRSQTKEDAFNDIKATAPVEAGIGREKQKEKRVISEKINEIVITATKSGVNKKETGASITVITAEQIEQKEKMNVVDLLKDTTGIHVSQSSPFGGLADLYMRGTNSNHVVVLIDGVKVNDPSSAGHGFDFSHLTTDNIDRIEIVRGSQSTLYGSDAIGGVINIITKRGEGKPRVTARVEGGSFCTFKESAGVSGGTDWAYYSFIISRTDSRGFNRTSSWRGVRRSFLRNQRDGYNNTSISARTGVKTFHDSWLSLSLRFTDAAMKIANGAFEEDKNHTFDNQNLSFKIQYDIPIFEWWESAMLFSYMNQYQRDKNLPDFYEFITSDIATGGFGSFGYTNMSFRGKTLSGEFKNKFMIQDIDEIICGVSYEKEYAATMPYWAYFNQFFIATMDPTSPIDKNAGTWAAYAQNHLKLYKRVFIIAGARFTQPDHFTYSMDYSISGSFILPVTETRFKANVGTGYKIPSLYQLYNAFERYNRFTFAYLKPERTLSYDVGAEQPLWKDRIILEVNYFSIDYKNLIVYDTILDNYGRYWNSDALSRGVECIASFKPVDECKINFYYTFTRMQDKTFRYGDMVRRPRHQTGISINYSFLNRGNVNLGFTYVGKRRDYWLFPFFSPMNPYYKIDLAASWWIIEQLQVFFRMENLLNKKYEEIRGYRMPGFTMYGGLKAMI